MADLPDYYTQAQISEAEAAKFKGGLDANKSATPVSRDIYLATDTHKLYVCITDGAWTGFDASILTQGILTLYANLVAGGYRVTGLGAPAAQDDALRYGRAEIRNAEIAAAAAIAYSKLNLALAIGNADIAVDAAIAVSKLVNTYFPETLMTTQGDLLIRGAANPERLAKITTGQILEATATGYQGVAKPAPTKEFFVPTLPIYQATYSFVIGDFATTKLDSDGEYALIDFKVPHDFTAIVSAEIIVIPTNTNATNNWDIASDYGAIGEAYNAHSEADAASTYNTVANQLFAVDIAGILSVLAANDYVGIRITVPVASGHQVNVVGVRFRYN